MNASKTLSLGPSNLIVLPVFGGGLMIKEAVCGMYSRDKGDFLIYIYYFTLISIKFCEKQERGSL